MGRNDTPDEDAMIGRVCVFDMGDFAFFAYIYAEWKPGKIVYRHYKEILNVLLSYTPNLERNIFLERIVRGVWTGSASYTSNFPLNQGSTTLSTMLYYNFQPENIFYTSSKGVASIFKSGEGENDSSGIIRNH